MIQRPLQGLLLLSLLRQKLRLLGIRPLRRLFQREVPQMVLFPTQEVDGGIGGKPVQP